MYTIATQLFETLHPGATGLCFIIKVWLVTLIALTNSLVLPTSHRWYGYDLQLSLKADNLSINFSNVATRSDVSPQIYASPQSLMSGCWFNIIDIRMLPTGISDGQQNQRVYNQYWQRVNCMHQCSIVNLLDIPSWLGIWIKLPDILRWGAWMARQDYRNLLFFVE